MSRDALSSTSCRTWWICFAGDRATIRRWAAGGVTVGTRLRITRPANGAPLAGRVIRSLVPTVTPPAAHRRIVALSPAKHIHHVLHDVDESASLDIRPTDRRNY